MNKPRLVTTAAASKVFIRCVHHIQVSTAFWFKHVYSLRPALVLIQVKHLHKSEINHFILLYCNFLCMVIERTSRLSKSSRQLEGNVAFLSFMLEIEACLSVLDVPSSKTKSWGDGVFAITATKLGKDFPVNTVLVGFFWSAAFIRGCHEWTHIKHLAFVLHQMHLPDATFHSCSLNREVTAQFALYPPWQPPSSLWVVLLKYTFEIKISRLGSASQSLLFIIYKVYRPGHSRLWCTCFLSEESSCGGVKIQI